MRSGPVGQWRAEPFPLNRPFPEWHRGLGTTYLQQAGGEGVFDDVPSFPTPTVTTEAVVARNPEAIIIVDRGIREQDGATSAGKKDFLVSTLGPSVNAVRNDQFCYMDFIGFATGPRTAATLAAVAPCLHPELKFG